MAAGVFFSLDLWFWHRSIIYIGPGLSTLLANFQVFILMLVGILCGILLLQPDLGSAAVITGVFAQIEKIFNIKMPRFKVGTCCPPAFTAAVNRNGGIVGNL